MYKKFFVLIICIALMTVIFSGCAADKSPEKQDGMETKTENEDKSMDDNSMFTYAIGGDTGNTLNPLTANDRWSLMTCHLLYSQLYFIYPDGSIDYILAESLEPSDDGLSYTLKLKDGLKWSDGEPLTADDVIFTFNKKSELTPILMIDDKPIELEKVDDLTVVFKMPSVTASAKELLSAELFIVPKHVFEAKDSFDINMIEEKVVGAGPYTLEEYKTGQYLKFKKNDYYVNGLAQIDTIVYRIIEKNDTAALALQNGEIDAWIGLPNLLDPFADNGDYTITNYNESRVAYMRLNRTSENMKDIEYRKGVLMALDRNEIMLASYSDEEFFKLGYSFLPVNNSFYTEDLEKWEQDLEKAKELTANGPKNLKLAYIQDNEVQLNQALTIQAELKAIGINVELVGMNQAAWVKAAFDNSVGDYDIYLGGYIMGVDPEMHATLFSTKKDNIMNFDSKEIDELFEKGNTTLDEKERIEIYNELQRKISEEAIFYPLGSNLRTLVMSSRIGGVEDAKLVPIYTFGDLSKLKLK